MVFVRCQWCRREAPLERVSLRPPNVIAVLPDGWGVNGVLIHCPDDAPIELDHG